MAHRIKCLFRVHKVITRSILWLVLMYPRGPKKQNFFGPDAILPPNSYHHNNHQVLFVYLIILCASNHDKVGTNLYPICRSSLSCYIIGGVASITLTNALSFSKIYSPSIDKGFTYGGIKQCEYVEV